MDDKDYCAREIYAERLERYKWLNGLSLTPEFGKDRVILYDARDHFIIPGKEPPMWMMGKLDIRLDFDASHLTTLLGIQQAAGVVSCDYQFDDIQIYVYYVEPTPEQKTYYEDLKRTQGISFPYRVFTQKSETITGDTYDSDIPAPSSVACMAWVCFINKGTEPIQSGTTSKEINF